MKVLQSPITLEQGPFNVVEQTAEGYLADGSLYPFSVVGECQIVDVPEGYVPQWVLDAQAAAERDAFNEAQKRKRFAAYTLESDPIFFKSQRGEATHQEWLDKVAEIDAQFPYKT